MDSIYQTRAKAILKIFNAISKKLAKAVKSKSYSDKLHVVLHTIKHLHHLLHVFVIDQNLYKCLPEIFRVDAQMTESDVDEVLDNAVLIVDGLEKNLSGKIEEEEKGM